ncbi:hypothetical protein MMC15_008170 [Xylographa vitiligo]|nr:hypothetical protein [Xylographa vitiligo]
MNLSFSSTVTGEDPADVFAQIRRLLSNTLLKSAARNDYFRSQTPSEIAAVTTAQQGTTKPQNGGSQTINVSANVVASVENGERPRGSPIVIPATTKPAPGPTANIPDVRRKRKFSSSGGTDEVGSKILLHRMTLLATSDRGKLSVVQGTVQSRPEVLRKMSIANPGVRPGKRSIHDKAKVKIDMYIRNEAGTFVLWSFGKLHDSTFDEDCANISAEYDRPIGSIVFELIAGGTVISVEVERSGGIGYQLLDEKLANVVKMCKYGGTIRINADPQTPEDADLGWVYDPL